MTVLVAATAAALSWSRTPAYAASADVLVNPQVVVTGTTPLEPDMGSEMALASSAAVRDIAASRLHVDADALTGLSVSVPLNTHVLHFAYTAPSATTAQKNAQAFAEAYVAYARSHMSGIGRVAARLAPEVISAATLPKSPSSPNHVVDVGIAVIVGLILGLAAAWLRDRLDDRPRGSDDLERATGVPVLAAPPRTRIKGRNATRRLVTLDDPSSKAAIAIEDLRRRIRRIAAPDGSKVLLVTGVRTNEHMPTAVDLAISLARSYRRVLLVNAGDAQPAIESIATSPQQSGLVDVLDHEAELADTVTETIVPGLDLLSRGRGHAVAENTELRRLFRQLRAMADFVIVAGPDTFSADIGAYGDLVDLTVLVVDARYTSRTQARAAVNRLEQFENGLAGCVLTGYGRRAERLRRDPARPRTVRSSPVQDGKVSEPVPEKSLADRVERP